jgi:hypothetical protein
MICFPRALPWGLAHVRVLKSVKILLRLIFTSLFNAFDNPSLLTVTYFHFKIWFCSLIMTIMSCLDYFSAQLLNSVLNFGRPSCAAWD